MGRFLKEIKLLKRISSITTFMLIICIVCIGLCVMFTIYKCYAYSIISILMSAIISACIYFIRKKFIVPNENYEINLNSNCSFEKLNEQLLKKSSLSYSYNDNCSVYLLKIKKKQFRILIYNTDSFDKNEYSKTKRNANNKFNKINNIKSVDSIFNISLQRNINMILVGKSNESLKNILKHTADNNIERATPLINAVVFNNKLFIPYLLGYDFSSVYAYEEMVKLIISFFEAE